MHVLVNTMISHCHVLLLQAKWNMFSHSWFVKHSRPALSMMFQAELPPFLGKPNGSQRHTDWPENWEYLRQLPAAWLVILDSGELSKVEWYPQKNPKKRWVVTWVSRCFKSFRNLYQILKMGFLYENCCQRWWFSTWNKWSFYEAFSTICMSLISWWPLKPVRHSIRSNFQVIGAQLE